MDIYYIYQHRRKDTGQIFYVGKGKGKRCFQKSNRNKHWHNITTKTEYEVEILFDNLSEDLACFTEIGVITKYKKDGIELCNYTIGGEGTSGFKHSDKSKKVMSRKKKGFKLSEEHKNKISLSSKGKVISKEQREKISNSLKGKKLSEEHKLKIKQSLTK
jgi:hypothetical protein